MKVFLFSSPQKVDLANCNDESLAVEYDVCHDKGTYDAVSLCPDDPSSKRAAYMKAVHCITRKNGLFIITSCNWTQEELCEQFSDCRSRLFFFFLSNL